MRQFFATLIAIVTLVGFTPPTLAGEWHYGHNGRLTHHPHHGDNFRYLRSHRFHQAPRYYRQHRQYRFYRSHDRGGEALAGLLLFGLGMAAGAAVTGNQNQSWEQTCHDRGGRATHDIDGRLACIAR